MRDSPFSYSHWIIFQATWSLYCGFKYIFEMHLNLLAYASVVHLKVLFLVLRECKRWERHNIFLHSFPSFDHFFTHKKTESFKVHNYLLICIIFHFSCYLPSQKNKKILAVPPTFFVFLIVFKIRIESKVISDLYECLILVHLVVPYLNAISKMGKLWGILLSFFISGLFVMLHEVYTGAN